MEADETYVGGLAKNMHERKRKQRITKGNASDKAVVMGMLQRGDGTVHSRVLARVIKDANAKVLQGAIRENVEPGSPKGAENEAPEDKVTRGNFEALVKGLFRVTPEQYAAEEARQQAEKAERAKSG